MFMVTREAPVMAEGTRLSLSLSDRRHIWVGLEGATKELAPVFAWLPPYCRQIRKAQLVGITQGMQARVT